MEFKLEVKKFQERVTELESTVEKLQRELKLMREAKSDVADQTSSETDTDAVTDVTDETQQHEEVNFRCSYTVLPAVVSSCVTFILRTICFFSVVSYFW